jgi:hypothetical protein
MTQGPSTPKVPTLQVATVAQPSVQESALKQPLFIVLIGVGGLLILYFIFLGVFRKSMTDKLTDVSDYVAIVSVGINGVTAIAAAALGFPSEPRREPKPPSQLSQLRTRKP